MKMMVVNIIISKTYTNQLILLISGLDFMHHVTVNMGLSYELRIDMISFPRYENNDFTGPEERGYAKYKTFSVAGPTSFYRLSVGGFSGNWGKSDIFGDRSSSIQ